VTMGTSSTLNLLALVAHARRVPGPERERFAQGLRETSRIGLVLETCHRVEWYGPADADPVTLPAGGLRLADEEAARHAIALAIGIDSVVIGEDQVLHQLRESVDAARREGRLDAVLDRLLTFALRAGRRARSWRGGRPRSLADVAVAAIERRIGSVAGRPLLVVGAGKMGGLAARAASAAGAQVVVTSRTPSRAVDVGRAIGCGTTAFDPADAVADMAALIVALRGPWPIAYGTARRLLEGRSIVVDLSVPPSVTLDVAEGLGGRFISADDLVLQEPVPAEDDPSAARLHALVDATHAEFSAWLEAHGTRAAVRALAERVESERQAELADLWSRLPAIDPEARAAIDRMSRHLAERILREPLERLRSDPDGRRESAARELWAL
jgi:glutamyl-tRNA reductase